MFYIYIYCTCSVPVGYISVVQYVFEDALESVWRSGSARTRWGSLSASPDPLAAIWGLLLRGG